MFAVRENVAVWCIGHSGCFHRSCVVLKVCYFNFPHCQYINSIAIVCQDIFLIILIYFYQVALSHFDILSNHQQ